MKATVFPAINYLAVIVTAIVSFVIGAILFAPPVLGNTFLKLINRKQEEVMKPGTYVGAFITTVITTLVLAVFIGYAGAKTVLDGAVIGLWAWFGFLLTFAVSNVLFEGRPTKYLALNAGTGLVFFLVMGAILGAWPP